MRIIQLKRFLEKFGSRAEHYDPEVEVVIPREDYYELFSGASRRVQIAAAFLGQLRTCGDEVVLGPKLQGRAFSVENNYVLEAFEILVGSGAPLFNSVFGMNAHARHKGKPWAYSLKGVDLSGWTFEESVLRRVDFRGAKLRDAKFVNCDLRRTRWQGADLAGAKFDDCIGDIPV